MSGERPPDMDAWVDRCLALLPRLRKKELTHVLSAQGLIKSGNKEAQTERASAELKALVAESRLTGVRVHVESMCKFIDDEYMTMNDEKYGSGSSPTSSRTWSRDVPSSGQQNHNGGGYAAPPPPRSQVNCVGCAHDPQSGYTEETCVRCGKNSHPACYRQSKLEVKVNGGFTCVACSSEACDPFFQILETVDRTPVALRRSHSRGAPSQFARASFRLTPGQLQGILKTRTAGTTRPGCCRVLARTFALKDTSRHGDHQWPKATKLLVNGQHAYLKQRKFNSFDNKWKGFSEPADITLLCRAGKNTIEVSTTEDLDEKYGLVVQIANLLGDADIVAAVAARESPSIASGYERALNSFREDADGIEIVITHTNLSLKCPLSLAKITVPGRGRRCTHLQCFDLLSYVGMNKKGSVNRWRCGVCNSVLRPADLIRDQWMEDMIRRAPFGTVDIKINQDGTWQPLDDDGKPLAPRRSLAVDDAGGAAEGAPAAPIDDDAKPPPAKKSKAKVLDIDLTPAKPAASAAGGMGPASPPPPVEGPARPPSRAKAKAAVVDLTLSSDEEDDLPPPRVGQAQQSRLDSHFGAPVRDPPVQPEPDPYAPPLPPDLAAKRCPNPGPKS